MYGIFWGSQEVLEIYEDNVSKDEAIKNIMIEHSRDFKEIKGDGGGFTGFHNIMLFADGTKEDLQNTDRNSVIDSGEYGVVSVMSYFTKRQDENISLFLTSLDFMDRDNTSRISLRIEKEIVQALKRLTKKKIVSFIEDKIIDYLLNKIETGNMIEYFNGKTITFFAGQRLILLNKDKKFSNIIAGKLDIDPIDETNPKQLVDYKLDSVVVSQAKNYAKINNMNLTDLITEALKR